MKQQNTTAVSLADIQSMRQSLAEWDNEMRTKTSLMQSVLDDILHLAVVPDDDQEQGNEEATIAVDEPPKLRLRHACRGADTTTFLSTTDLLEQLPPSTPRGASAPTSCSHSAHLDDKWARRVSAAEEDHEDTKRHRKKRHSRRRRHKSKKPSKSHAARSSSPMERYGQQSDSRTMCFAEGNDSSLKSFHSAPPFLGESSSSLHSSLHSSNHSRRRTSSSSRKNRSTQKLKDNKDWKDIMKQLDDLKKSQRDLKKEQKKILKQAQEM